MSFCQLKGWAPFQTDALEITAVIGLKKLIELDVLFDHILHIGFLS